jgi:Tfp pilus assembly protein PilN
MDADPVPPAVSPTANGFSMPEYAPKAEVKLESVASGATPNEAGARVTGPKFHIPEPSAKNSLLNGRVDLIPVAARVRSWQQILTLFGFAVLLSVFILGAIYVYVMYEEQRIVAEQNRQKEEIAKIEEKILDFTQLNKDINILGQEIKLVQDALNKHIYWTNFFELLEKYTVSDVYYSGLAVGTNGGLTLNASTNSYDSVAKQLKVLNGEKAKEFATEASITGAKRDAEGTVTFQVVLALNQSLFYYRSAP